MSYCLNPTCSNPENLTDTEQCQSCSSQLTMLRDRYQVVKALAQGGFGATFLALDQILPGKPNCVIKQLRPTVTQPEVLRMARDLFQREAETLGRIGNHPQVPRLLDYFEDNNQFYLVQEYVSGLTLQQEIKRSGIFSEAGVRQFLTEILPILQYIHEQQVIHRDIKPANLIRRSIDNKLVLIDFGAVKNQIANSDSDQTVLTAYAIGTHGFAPPEQIAMRPVYASDIYAVGVTCLYLLTGKMPKAFNTNPSTGELLWQETVQVSDHFATVLRKMLEVSVRHRYQSAQDVLKALSLEPYMDSLAQGMATQITTRGRSLNEDESNYATKASPQVASVAAAIRARRAKPSETTSSLSGMLPSQVWKSKSTNSVATLKPQTANPQVVKDSGPLNSDDLLKAYAKGRRDFAQRQLTSLKLSRVDLSGVNFHSSKLEGTNFQGTNLFNTNFGQASLNHSNLRNANLSQAYFSHADLADADLRGADLSYAYLNNANLRGANLCGADLTGAKVSETQLALAKINWLTVMPNGKRAML